MSEYRNESRFTTLIALLSLGLTLLLGSISLYLSFDANRTADEANQITRTQFSDRLVAVDLSPIINPAISSDQPLYCRFRLRLTNIGGAASNVVDYSTKVSYKGKEVLFASRGQYEAVKSSSVIAPFTYYQSFLWNSDVPHDALANPEPYALKFPYRLEESAAVDIRADVWLFRENASPTTPQIESWVIAEPIWSSYDPTKLATYMPIEVNFELKTASGTVTTSPASTCWYME